MRKSSRTIISILISGLITANVNSSSAASNIENGCDFYDSETASIPNVGVKELLQSLPKSSTVIVCSGNRSVEISILDPIESRDGVSYYRRNSSEIAADRFSKATSAKDLLSDRWTFHRTMMALDPNSELTHQSENIVSTQSISVGTFKILYNLWLEVIEDSQKFEERFDKSNLDGESKSQYEKLVQSLNNSAGTKIYYIDFKELRLADGDGIDLEFFPRLTVNISTKTQWWEIDYDVLDGARYKLLNIELRSEATGAK